MGKVNRGLTKEQITAIKKIEITSYNKKKLPDLYILTIKFIKKNKMHNLLE